MSRGCYVCGSAELAEGADPLNPLCARCVPVRDHVVSMKRARGWLVAECRCGWTYETDSYEARDRAVREHWRQTVEMAE